MGKQSRMRQAAPEVMLHRKHAPAVAVTTLIDVLLLDMKRTMDLTTYQLNIVDGMMGKNTKLSDTFPGRVTDSLALLFERYLCKVQDAMDTFFEEITEADLGEIARIKANWPLQEAA